MGGPILGKAFLTEATGGREALRSRMSSEACLRPSISSLRREAASPPKRCLPTWGTPGKKPETSLGGMPSLESTRSLLTFDTMVAAVASCIQRSPISESMD